MFKLGTSNKTEVFLYPPFKATEVFQDPLSELFVKRRPIMVRTVRFAMSGYKALIAHIGVVRFVSLPVRKLMAWCALGLSSVPGNEVY